MNILFESVSPHSRGVQPLRYTTCRPATSFRTAKPESFRRQEDSYIFKVMSRMCQLCDICQIKGPIYVLNNSTSPNLSNFHSCVSLSFLLSFNAQSGIHPANPHTRKSILGTGCN